jgi:thiosulfate dehydrogenase
MNGNGRAAARTGLDSSNPKPRPGSLPDFRQPACHGMGRRDRIALVKLAICAATLTVFTAFTGAACSRATPSNPLVRASTTMVTAWQIPLDPLKDPSLTDPRLAEQIKWGYRIFVDTPREAPRFTGGTVACANCHLNAGQRERALPVVGVAGMFPEYNNRAARLISLADRVVDCFLRSENATGRDPDALPSPTSKEVLAVSAYLAWLSRGHAVGVTPPWRGRNTIAAEQLIPIAKLDVDAGQAIYAERCTSCHGAEGEGVQIGDKKAGPLWGPGSWNDGAGAARVYTLAGIIRYSMPYLNPGSLTDVEAQQVAAYITSKPRPVFPFKDRDYAGSKVPADAVYYHAGQ